MRIALTMLATAMLCSCGDECETHCSNNSLHTCVWELDNYSDEITVCGLACKEWTEDGQHRAQCIADEDPCPKKVESYCKYNDVLICAESKYARERLECGEIGCVYSKEYRHAACSPIKENCNQQGEEKCLNNQGDREQIDSGIDTTDYYTDQQEIICNEGVWTPYIVCGDKQICKETLVDGKTEVKCVVP